MHIGVPAETRANETRVAATPETVKKLRVAGSPGHGAARRGLCRELISTTPSRLPARNSSMPHTAFAADLVLKVHSPDRRRVAAAEARRGAGRHARSF